MQEVLDTGDAAVATARKLGIRSFKRTTPKNYHAVKLDITDPSDIQSALTTAPNKFSRINVMINNTGYSRPFEELSDSQIRRQMTINFFSLINVMMTAVETTKGV